MNSIWLLGPHYGEDELLSFYFKDRELRYLKSLDDINVMSLEGKKKDLIVYCGGEDISPSIYGEKRSKHTWAGDTPSNRDQLEISAFKVGLKAGMIHYGICRGAQLMCALAGGKLYQHVTNHGGGRHPLTDAKTKERYLTTSAHHQMMHPGNVKHEIIAYTSPVLSRVHIFNDNVKEETPDIEPEIIWFNDIKAFCVQGHPEWMRLEDPFVKYQSLLLMEKIYASK